MTLPEDCQQYGTEHGRGENLNRVFVHYELDIDGAHEESEWVDELPTKLHALVCTECGFVLGMFDKSKLDKDEQPTRSDRFRVDREVR